MISTFNESPDFSGARGSNAGDQFHELWALQKALELLDRSTKLSALQVEGVKSTTTKHDELNSWEGVDCSLYYGGKSLETADKVELVQLKYSAANPASTWTITRLTENTRKTGNNSVLRRLADAYFSARQKMKVDAQLTISLVSNQPIAQELLNITSNRSSTPVSYSRQDPEVANLLKTISETIEKTDDELFNFLSDLDFSNCGGRSRFAIRDEVVRVVADSIEEEANAQVNQLQIRIHELMLPERARETITFETVLGWFDIANMNGLFPAPAEFKETSASIPRKPTSALLESINGGAIFTCLHGPAGCGKTTTMRQLENVLPQSSKLILFDCYGGGRYIYSNDRRHLPQNAFVQICNDVSLSIGAPFLIAR
jgi:hypothetical protein